MDTSACSSIACPGRDSILPASHMCLWFCSFGSMHGCILILPIDTLVLFFRFCAIVPLSPFQTWLSCWKNTRTKTPTGGIILHSKMWPPRWPTLLRRDTRDLVAKRLRGLAKPCWQCHLVVQANASDRCFLFCICSGEVVSRARLSNLQSWNNQNLLRNIWKPELI